MYRKNLTLAALIKQCELIDELVQKMESTPHMNSAEIGACQYRVNELISNFKQLRKIQKTYQKYGKKSRLFCAESSMTPTYLTE